MKKSLNLQGEENLRQIAYVQGIILPQGGKILHGQCLCVRDKFHVCLAFLPTKGYYLGFFHIYMNNPDCERQ